MQTSRLPHLLCLLSLSAATACGGTQRAPLAQRSAPVYESSAADSSGGSYEASATAPGYDTGHVGGDIYQPTPNIDTRPGLGTSFGEQRESRVQHTRFVRSSSSPTAILALNYNNASGVEAAFAHHGAQMAAARSYAGDGNVAVTITDEYGRALSGGPAGGRFYVVGRDGDRYNIEIRNDTRYRLEIVASVDGLDVIDGEGASPDKRGYVLAPFTAITIDGFRTSDDTVAAFRFGAVGESYAARTTGDRNVGVIGVAIFSEQGAEWTIEELNLRDTADPFPGYAKPPTPLAR